MRGSFHQHIVRPERVAAIRGIAFQADGDSVLADVIIRPFAMLNRWVAGLGPCGREPLANHVGVHLVMWDGREVIVEQLVGPWDSYLRNALNWTPIDRFQERDNGGWHVTIPATTFRDVNDGLVAQTIARLNVIEGRSYLAETCTQFVQRAFGGRRLFVDSPLLRRLGIGVRVGDPALPLLRSDARLAPRAAHLLDADAVRACRSWHEPDRSTA